MNTMSNWSLELTIEFISTSILIEELIIKELL